METREERLETARHKVRRLVIDWTCHRIRDGLSREHPDVVSSSQALRPDTASCLMLRTNAAAIISRRSRQLALGSQMMP